jgi:putative endopeptidase
VKYRNLIAAVFIVMAFPLANALGQEGASTHAKVSGIDKSLFSDTVSAGENFYLYANQKWLDETKIPADKSNYGIFTVLDDKTREQVRELIEKASAANGEPGSAAQKVGDLYRSVLNVQTRNQGGTAPIQDLLLLINRSRTKRDIAATLGSLSAAGVGGPLVPYVNVDARDSDSYAVYVTQSGLTLPDRDYYLEDEPRYVKIRGELLTYIADMLSFLRVSDPENAAQAIFEMETKIAENHWTKTENRDPEKTYNKKSADEMRALVDGFPWSVYADTSGISGEPDVIVRQPSYATEFVEMYDNYDI